MTPANDIALLLADRVDPLVRELLPGGIREGHSWRCGSVAGEAGTSLAVELTGPKRGIWIDHANPDHRGDALDLVRLRLDVSTAEAILWAERWLGIAPGEVRTIPRQPVPKPVAAPPTWPKIWRAARPIAGTVAERYLEARGLSFTDPLGDVLRFEPRRARLKPGADSEFEHHPALLALIRDVLTGGPCGMHSIHLRNDGSDRLRDKKGKTSAGRVSGGAVMLSDFADVTMGLTIAEGVETAIGVLMDGLAPAWALCGASNLAKFPVLAGIDALTVAADTGAAGQTAAQEVAARWRRADREARLVSPAFDDWAARRKIAS
jgi:hypothetical protein